MDRPPLRVVRQAFPDSPAFGTAVSRAILNRVGHWRAARRRFASTAPAPTLAFSRQDRASPGFAAAVRAAREAGFQPVLRLAGGRAAVFHEGRPWPARGRSPTPARRPAPRNASGSWPSCSRAALGGLGVDARVGEVPREYCPGAWSVNAGGRTKLVGIGQRLIAGAAHRGAVVVVGGSERIRGVLVPVYDALGLDWDPATAGSVEDEIGEVELAAVEDAILAGLSEQPRADRGGARRHDAGARRAA